MDNFTRNEIIGRMAWCYYLAENGVKKNVFSEDRFCHYDGTLTGLSDTTAIYEIKYRDIPTELYREKGWLLEKKKAEPLITSSVVSGYDKALYIVITRDDVLMWDIKNLNAEYEDLYCTKTTAEDYQKGQVRKSVTFLKEDDAVCRKKRKDGMRLLMS